MKNTLLFTYSTNILIRLLTVNMNNFLTPGVVGLSRPDVSLYNVFKCRDLRRDLRYMFVAFLFIIIIIISF